MSGLDLGQISNCLGLTPIIVFIPEQTIEEIQSRLDIVEVVSKYFPLKRAGRNFKALCPFHQEKTPSFMVSADKQIFRCFGCGAGGDVFSFVMRYERLTFPEAARKLAAKTGVRIPEASVSSPPSPTALLFKINEFAAAYYQNNLVHRERGRSCREYLARRGISPQIIRDFRLGYAPPSGEGLLAYARTQGWQEETLRTAGLITSGRPEGKARDLFRQRVIFPIANPQGKILAFGGRALGENEPKYLNSPETPIFRKGKVLYGLNLSRDAIIKKDEAIVVEGYLDFLALFQKEIRNACASLGTALTLEQIRLIKRYCGRVILVFDGDVAGKLASLRGLDLLVEEEFRPRLVGLPPGFDPDSLLQQKGKEAFLRLLSGAKDIFDYKMEVITSIHAGEGLDAKLEITREMLATIARVKNEVARSEYIKRLSRRLAISEDALRTELRKVKPATVNFDLSEFKFRESLSEVSTPEKTLLTLMLRSQRAVAFLKSRIKEDAFPDSVTREIAREIFRTPAGDFPLSVRRLVRRLNNEKAAELIAELSVSAIPLDEEEKILGDCLRRLERNRIRSQITGLLSKIKKSAGAERRTQLAELSRLTRQHSKIR